MKDILKSFLGVFIGLGVGLLVVVAVGENPLVVLKAMTGALVSSPYDIGMTLFYTTPLIFTGLAVAIPLRAGLFNIGAEGQLMVGAMAAAVLPQVVSSPFLAVFGAILISGIWGGLIGWLKARRGAHEVIVSILMNFIAVGITSTLANGMFKDPDSQLGETAPVAEVFHSVPFSFFAGAPTGVYTVFALFLPYLLYGVMKRSVWGYQLRAVGLNETAATLYGIERGRVWILAMMAAGAVAGFVGCMEVFGNAHKFRMGFSPEWGFSGIAVALLARGKFSAIVPSALLFGMISKGSLALELETEKMTREYAMVLQGIIILSVTLTHAYKKRAK